jgi:glutamate formiminotransferase
MRDQTAAWLARELGLGVYLYGDERSLPQLRREVRDGQPADRGPRTIDPRIGASAVGERPPLVAWNIWLRGLSLADTHHLARSLRSPALRTLALPYGELTQLSCNLVDLDNCGPATVFDQVARVHRDHIERCELVGLIPASVLARTEQSRWAQLDLSPAATIESRL